MSDNWLLDMIYSMAFAGVFLLASAGAIVLLMWLIKRAGEWGGY